MVEVILSSALICFGGECYPALVGATTPVGEYTLIRYRVRDSRYGGDVLEFLRVGKEAFSIHRTWPGRETRYVNASVYRRIITNGCVNVQPEVYDRLLSCCNGAPLEIRP